MLPPRQTNLALLGALVLAFATGIGAVWTGYLRVDKPDTYTLSIRSDDGARLFIGDKLIINNPNPTPEEVMKDKTATRYTKLTFDEAFVKNLKVMDATALALCRDQKLPINVFSIFKAGALKRVVMGEDEGTLVHN